jgi:hypothetical protein
MLTQEEITTNAAKFFKVGMKYGFVTDSLVESLGTDFVSKDGDLGFGYDGGLIDFTLKVTDYAIKFNDILPEDKRVEKEALIKFIFVSAMAGTLLNMNRVPKLLTFALRNGINMEEELLSVVDYVVAKNNGALGNVPTLILVTERAKELTYQFIKK